MKICIAHRERGTKKVTVYSCTVTISGSGMFSRSTRFNFIPELNEQMYNKSALLQGSLTHTCEKNALTSLSGWYRARWPIRELCRSRMTTVPDLWIPVRSCMSIMAIIRLPNGTTSKSEVRLVRWLNTTTMWPSGVSLGDTAKHLK